MLVTPPLPLPYKGGELLPPNYPQALPSLVGELLPPTYPQSLPSLVEERLPPTYSQALPSLVEELLPPTYPQALPSLVGEGQGWGQYCYNLYLLSNDSKSLLQSYYKKIKPQRESAILFLTSAICLTLSGFYQRFVVTTCLYLLETGR